MSWPFSWSHLKKKFFYKNKTNQTQTYTDNSASKNVDFPQLVLAMRLVLRRMCEMCTNYIFGVN